LQPIHVIVLSCGPAVCDWFATCEYEPRRNATPDEHKNTTKQKAGKE